MGSLRRGINRTYSTMSEIGGRGISSKKSLEPTVLRLSVAANVKAICSVSSVGLAKWKHITDDVAMETGQTPGAVGVMLFKMMEDGWVERPFRGSYRLTVEGEEALEKWTTLS